MESGKNGVNEEMIEEISTSSIIKSGIKDTTNEQEASLF
jgi:RNA-binding protein YhbY